MDPPCNSIQDDRADQENGAAAEPRERNNNNNSAPKEKLSTWLKLASASGVPQDTIDHVKTVLSTLYDQPLAIPTPTLEYSEGEAVIEWPEFRLYGTVYYGDSRFFLVFIDGMAQTSRSYDLDLAGDLRAAVKKVTKRLDAKCVAESAFCANMDAAFTEAIRLIKNDRDFSVALRSVEDGTMPLLLVILYTDSDHSNYIPANDIRKFLQKRHPTIAGAIRIESRFTLEPVE